MASSPELYDEPARPNSSGAKPPITASPAFRWVVAIWFAALLGVGSLIVPVVLLERASTATGLASILPQAAPPLGFTARALIAGVGTVGGALLGLLLARLLVRDRQPNPARVASRRPLSPADDLAELDNLDDFDETAPPATVGGRRRALAIAEEEGPSDFLAVAPLPGVNAPEEAIEFHPEDPEPEPVEEAAPEAPQIFQPIEPDDAEQPFELEPSAELTDEQEAEEHDADEFIPPEPHFERQEFIAVAEASEPVVEADEPEAEPQPVMEPLAFSPPSMARTVVGYDQHEDADEVMECEFETDGQAAPGFTLNDIAVPESEEYVSDKQIFDAPEDAEPAPFDQPAIAAAGQEVGESEDGGEGLVQLVQRLGATLEKHREWSAEQAAAEPEPEPEPVVEEDDAAEKAVPEDFDPAAADEAAEAMAAWFGSSPAAPAAPAAAQPAREQQYAAFANRLTSVSEDEDEIEDEVAELTATFSLPLAATPAEGEDQRPAFDQSPAGYAKETADSDVDAEEYEDDSADSAQFASLNPFAGKDEEFVRIEEPEPEADSAEPAVLFPGQESRRASDPGPRAFDPPAGQAENAAARAERPKPSNDDNERALREALMNLQRMGK